MPPPPPAHFALMRESGEVGLTLIIILEKLQAYSQSTFNIYIHNNQTNIEVLNLYLFFSFSSDFTMFNDAAPPLDPPMPLMIKVPFTLEFSICI